MKKIKKVFIALVLVLSFVLVNPFSKLDLSLTNTKDVLYARESDWPDYNYGNWKEIAEHPEDYAEILRCISKVIVEQGLTGSAEYYAGVLATPSAIFVLGFTTVVRMGSCLF